MTCTSNTYIIEINVLTLDDQICCAVNIPGPGSMTCWPKGWLSVNLCFFFLYKCLTIVSLNLYCIRHLKPPGSYWQLKHRAVHIFGTLLTGSFIKKSSILISWVITWGKLFLRPQLKYFVFAVIRHKCFVMGRQAGSEFCFM